MRNDIFIFYLHLPKCAGMTLLNYFVEKLGENKIYQSTSLIQNYWNNKYEYIFMPSPKELRVFFGHWLHEEMLKQTDWRTPYLVTSIREPVSRFKSQYRYDAKIANETGNKMTDKEIFLKTNSNVYARFLTKTFPTFVTDSENLLKSSLEILQFFDFIYASAESDCKIPILASRTGFECEGAPVKINQSEHTGLAVPFSDNEILDANRIDVEIYNAFTSAKNLDNYADNPLYSSERRDELNSYLRTPYDKQREFDYLIEPLLEEYKRYDVLKETINRFAPFITRGSLACAN